MAAGLRSDPLGELKRSPRPPCRKNGGLYFYGEGRGREEEGERKGGEEREGEGGRGGKGTGRQDRGREVKGGEGRRRERRVREGGEGKSYGRVLR